jgi:hypothetical protein
MKTETIKFNDFWLPLALVALTFAKEKKSKGDYEAFCQRQPRSRKGSLTDRLKICAHLIEVNHIVLVGEVMTLSPNPSFQWLDSQLINGDEAAWDFLKELGFKDKIGRKYNDANKKKIGEKGEQFVLQQLYSFFPENKHHEIIHTSLADDSAGYDIECPDFEMGNGKFFLEVKTTSLPGQDFTFYISRNEYEVALTKPNEWMIILIKLVNGEPKFFGKLKYDFIDTQYPKEDTSSSVSWESLKVKVFEDSVEPLEFLDLGL